MIQSISQTGCLITQLRKAQWIVGYWGYTWCTEAGISPVLGEAFEIRHALLSGYHRFSVEIPPDLLNAQMLCSEKSFLNLPYWRRTVALYHLGFGWKHGKWLRSPVSCFVCFGSVKLCDVWNARPFRLFHCIRVLACRLSLFTFFLHVSLCLKIVWRGNSGAPCMVVIDAVMLINCKYIWHLAARSLSCYFCLRAGGCIVFTQDGLGLLLFPLSLRSILQLYQTILVISYWQKTIHNTNK